MSSAKAGKVKQALDDDVKADVKAIKEGSRKELSPVAARYLRNLANPAGSALGGIPTLVGGFSARSDVRRFRAKGTFSPGTLGFGFISISPMPCFTGGSVNLGPTHPLCKDAAIGCKSDSSWTGGALPNPTVAMPTGVTKVTLADSDLSWTQVGVTNGYANVYPLVELGYRCVGASIEVFAESSFSDSNGEITLLETPGHICPQGTSTPAGGGLSYDEIATNAHARTIRATQTSSQSEKIVLNYHPRGGRVYQGTDCNEFNYYYPVKENGIQPGTTTFQPWTMIVAVSGVPATMNFHFTVTAIYEIVGSELAGKVRPVDSRGMDLVANVLMSKNLSGYVGKPEHVEDSYLHQAWKHAQKAAGGWVSSKAKDLLKSSASLGLEALGGFL